VKRTESVSISMAQIRGVWRRLVSNTHAEKV
jgi:hypothetical protein